MNFVMPWRDEEIFESLRQAFQNTKEDGRVDIGGVVIGATCGDIHYIWHTHIYNYIYKYNHNVYTNIYKFEYTNI